MLHFHVCQIFKGFEFCLTNIGSHAAWQKYSNFSGAQTVSLCIQLWGKVTPMVSELLLHYIQISIIWWEGRITFGMFRVLLVILLVTCQPAFCLWTFIFLHSILNIIYNNRHIICSQLLVGTAHPVPHENHETSCGCVELFLNHF